MTKRKTYTKAFKIEAVGLAEKNGYAQTGRELGINAGLLHTWKNKLDEANEKGQPAFPGKGNPHDEELTKLRRELAQAKQDNEILKKLWVSLRAAPSKIPVHRSAPGAVSHHRYVSALRGFNERLLRLATSPGEPARARQPRPAGRDQGCA